MKSIKLNNRRLEKLLSNTTELFRNENILEITKKHAERENKLKDSLIPEYHPTSDEYLFKAFKLKLSDYAFPRAVYGASIQHVLDFHPNNKNVLAIRKATTVLKNTLGTEREALSMLYPDNGFIGWHHNGNAPGYNILLSHSLDGDGSFDYWDYETKSIKSIPDKPGWNVKVGYYPNQRKEPKRVYWHMAKTKKSRISIAWVIDQKDMWKNMIDQITEGDYNYDDILRQ